MTNLCAEFDHRDKIARVRRILALFPSFPRLFFFPAKISSTAWPKNVARMRTRDRARRINKTLIAVARARKFRHSGPQHREGRALQSSSAVNDREYRKTTKREFFRGRKLQTIRRSQKSRLAPFHHIFFFSPSHRSWVGWKTYNVIWTRIHPLRTFDSGQPTQGTRGYVRRFALINATSARANK